MARRGPNDKHSPSPKKRRAGRRRRSPSPVEGGARFPSFKALFGKTTPPALRPVQTFNRAGQVVGTTTPFTPARLPQPNRSGFFSLGRSPNIKPSGMTDAEFNMAMSGTTPAFSRTGAPLNASSALRQIARGPAVQKATGLTTRQANALIRREGMLGLPARQFKPTTGYKKFDTSRTIKPSGMTDAEFAHALDPRTPVFSPTGAPLNASSALRRIATGPGGKAVGQTTRRANALIRQEALAGPAGVPKGRIPQAMSDAEFNASMATNLPTFSRTGQPLNASASLQRIVSGPGGKYVGRTTRQANARIRQEALTGPAGVRRGPVPTPKPMSDAEFNASMSSNLPLFSPTGQPLNASASLRRIATGPGGKYVGRTTRQANALIRQEALVGAPKVPFKQTTRYTPLAQPVSAGEVAPVKGSTGLVVPIVLGAPGSIAGAVNASQNQGNGRGRRGGRANPPLPANAEVQFPGADGNMMPPEDYDIPSVRTLTGQLPKQMNYAQALSAIAGVQEQIGSRSSLTEEDQQLAHNMLQAIYANTTKDARSALDNGVGIANFQDAVTSMLDEPLDQLNPQIEQLLNVLNEQGSMSGSGTSHPTGPNPYMGEVIQDQQQQWEAEHSLQGMAMPRMRKAVKSVAMRLMKMMKDGASHEEMEAVASSVPKMSKREHKIIQELFGKMKM